MHRLSLPRFHAALASMLIAVFLGSQIFSCCLVNQRLGNFVKAAFTVRSESQATAHSCCPTPPAETKQKENSDPSQHKDCCIQDANQRLPQIPSEFASVPTMPDLVVGLSPTFLLPATWLPERATLLTASGPPIYLTQLRLLI